MFVNIPGGKPDGIKLIPVGDIATKDKFAAIKGITAQDVLTNHRFPAALAGIIPTNGGAGSGIPRSTMRPMPATKFCHLRTYPGCHQQPGTPSLPAGRFSGEYRFNRINKQSFLWQDRLLIWIEKGPHYKTN